jgi:DNA repair protein RadD
MSQRDYQERADRAIDAAYLGGKRAVLVQAPTGAGKTHVALTTRSKQPGQHLWIAPSNDLVRQVVERLSREGAACSWFDSAGRMHGRIDDASSLHVTTVQRLAYAHRHGKPLPVASFVVFDEARSMTAREWGEVASAYSSARILGLDATPMRADGSGLGGLFDCLIEVASVRELIDAGYLAPFLVRAPKTQLQELATVRDASGKPRRDAPVAAWQNVTPGESAMVFCATVQHAHDTREDFRAAGVVAESIDQTTPPSERARILSGLGRGSIQVVTNALILRQGIDVPEVSCVVLARPFGSLSAYLQAIGRGARPGPDKRCTVLDLMGAVHTHGLPDAPRTWHLEGEAVRLLEGLPPCVCCSGCLNWHAGGACPFCGSAPLPPPAPKVRAADLIEVRAQESDDRQSAVLARMVRDAYNAARQAGKTGPDADKSAFRGAHRWAGTYGKEPSRADVLAAIKAAREAYDRPAVVRPPAQLSLI